jgi:prepilin-type N-terminal cleavage/methylation domain-containing protein
MAQAKRQRGFTLAELTVAMAVGLVVLAGATSALVASNNNNLDNLRLIRLNQELRSLAGLMAADIRRAGYNGGAIALVGAGATTPSPFETVTIGSVSTAGDCILYSYDDSSGGAASTNSDGLLNGNEYYGFRLNGNTVQRLSASSAGTCTSGTWQALSDPNDTVVTALSFTLTDNEICNATLYSGMHVQTVTISITARPANIADMAIARTVTESVRTRNERYEYHAAGNCVNT